MSQQGQVGPGTFSARLKLAAVVLACSLGTLVSAMVLLSRQSQLVREVTRHQTSPIAWQAELPAVRVGLLEAESGARGYLAGRSAEFLQQYNTARRGLPAALHTLDAAAAADPTLAPLLNDIRRLAALKLSELDAVVSLAQQGDTPAALALVKQASSLSVEWQIRADIAAVTETVRAHHNILAAEVAARSAETQRLASITLGVLLIAVVLAAWQITRMTAAQERNERALTESEQRHRAIVEDQTEFIALSNADGSLVYVNPAYGRFFAVIPQELAGRGLYDSVLEADVGALRERIGTVLATGNPVSIEIRVTVADDQRKWVAWRHRLQHAADGAEVIHSVGREITLRKTAEENLRASQDFLSRTGRVAGVGGWELDLRTGRLNWSEHVKRIHEVPEDFVPTLDNAASFYTQLGQEAIGAAVEEGHKTGKPWDLELPLVTAKGRQIYVRAVGDVEFDSDGTAIRLVGAIQDITDRKVLERTLRDLTDVFDATTDFVAQSDTTGHVTYLNPSARRALGIAPDQPLERRLVAEFVTPETSRRLADEIIPAVTRDGIWVGETGVMLPGGRSIPVNHMVISHRDADGHVARYSSIIRDISDAVTARKALALQTATLQGVIEAMPAMVAVCDVSLHIRLVNKSFERWRGKSRRELVGSTVEAALGTWEYERSLPWIERALAGETVTFEKDYPTNQSLRYVALTYIPLRLADGTVDGFIGIAQDVTRDREENLRLQLLSEHCPLTGLLNRAGFEIFLNAQIAQNHGAQLAILYIDLDHFKPINDTHGHPVGDEVLQAFAVRLQGLVRPTDAVARLGGDEFAVALTGIRKVDDAALVADEIVNMARQPVWIGPLVLHIGASVGVAFDAAACGGWRDLVRRADVMVYQAKRNGRGQRVVAAIDSAADECHTLRAARSR